MLTLKRTGLLLLVALLAFGHSDEVKADDPPEVARIAQTAINAQNDGEFELAAKQWQQIVDSYPNSSQIGVALYQAGYCYVQTGNYAKASDLLKQSITKLDPAKKVSIAQAYLFQGYSQGKLGRELTNENPAEANRWLTTATATLAKLLERFPDFEDADQALYFQGDAYEALGRWDDAADSYSRMLKFDAPQFKLDGLFALGFIKSKQGKYDEAVKYYSQFESAGEQHPAFNEVRFRSALATQELARAAENLDDQKQTRLLLTQAASKFDEVYQSHDTDWADQARFEQGNCLSQLGRYSESAPVFESVVQITQSPLVDQARVYAGRDYMRSGNGTTAVTLLEKSVATSSAYSAVGAHWLSQFYLKADQPKKAYAIADQWITKTDDTNVQLPLMLDKADSAYAIPDRRAESQDLYMQIVNKYPESRLAPAALYNAAYAAMENRKFEDALAMTNQFRKQYPDSDYMIDVLEVETDSNLLNNTANAAEVSATQLVNTYNNHPKVNLWRLNVGLAQFLQSKYVQALETLEPIVNQLPSPAKKAEALHWIGCSQYKLDQTKASIQTLTQSHQTDAQWRFADETLMRLAQAYFADKQGDNAKQVAKKLIAEFPKSKLVAEANYRMGEFDYESGDYDGALASYAAVVDNYNDSQFVPYALYGIGWSYLQKNQNDFASTAFEKLTNRFPEHKLTKQVAVGRAAANRGQGKVDAAIADINSFLKTETDANKRQEAFYELGLAQIEKQDWPAVIKTFSELIELAPGAPLADRYHYELAWAHKSNNEAEPALLQFKTIAAKFPTSKLAAESNFHIGQNAYVEKDYPNAAKHFELAMASQDAAVKEKAHYKLAWSYYKQKQFENARAEFQKQIDTFPNGNLKADAMFMVSEALYETRKFDEALQKYKVAKPIIETSKTVSPNFKILTYLHGAQSANEAGKHDQAIEFASSLIDADVDQYVKQDAQMEIGDAYRAKNEPEKAIDAYSKAAIHPGTTGARSKCMMGEILFDQKEYAAAINEFKLVRYGFGGSEASDEIKKWQAFACYEAARCNMIQISTPDISNAEKKKFVVESMKHFQFLVENFPNDKLAAEAQRQLKKLEAVKL